MPTSKSTFVHIVFVLYLAIVSAVGLFTTTFAVGSLIDAGLKTWVFPAADVPSWLPDCTDPNYLGVRAVTLVDESDDSYDALAECEAQVEREMQRHRSEKARDAVTNLSMIIIGTPLFLFHWRLFQKERKSKKAEKEAKK